MISAVIFDVGGVLVSDGIRDHVIREASKYYKSSHEKTKNAISEIDKVVSTVNWDEETYWKRVVKYLDISNPPPFRSFWTEKFAEYTPINDAVMEIVRKLKSNGYKLAVLSNTIQKHVDSLRERGVYDLFDIETFSCDSEISSKKPEERIYRICLERLNKEPEECVFVDDKEICISGAHKVGLNTILFRSVDNLKKELEAFGVRI